MAKKPHAYLVTPEHPTFNLLVFGDQGNGKTVLGASAQDHPKMANVLFANIEGGMLSLVHRNDIHAEDIKTTQDVWDLGWRLANNEYSTVNTLVVDNITELQTLNLQEVVTAAIQGGRNMVKNRSRTIDDLWQEDYKSSTSQLARLFRMLRDLPINVVFTAHAKRVYPKVPEGTDLTKVDPIAIVPNLTQKLMEHTMGYMDFVWCLEIDEESETHERFLVTVTKGEYRCKTRGEKFYEAVGDIIKNPTLPDIYDTFVETAHRSTRRKRTT